MVTLPDTPLIRALRSLSVTQLREELEEIHRQKSSLETHESLVQLALRWKEGETNGRTIEAQPVTGPRPSARQAILLVLAEREGRWLKTDLIRELDRRDWMPHGKNPKNQITSRLSELVGRGEVIRHGPGEYSLGAKTARGTGLGDRQEQYPG